MTDHIRDAARDIWADDDLQIDNDAEIAPVPEIGGAWVQAWVFVPLDDEQQ